MILSTYAFLFLFSCCAGPSFLRMGFSLGEESRGCSVAAMRELPIGVPSPLVEQRLSGDQASVVAAHGLSSCSF